MQFRLWLETTTEVLYHGSSHDFDQFEKIGNSIRGQGYFFSNSPRYAKVFGPHIYTCRINLNKPKVFRTSADFTTETMRRDMMDDRKGAELLYQELKTEGYDGIIIERSKVSTGTVREVICFYPQSITILEKN